MPNFINRNHHFIFLDMGEKVELTKIKAFETFKATGRDADLCEETAGVVNLDTADAETLAEIDVQLNERGLAGLDGESPASGDGTVTTASVQGTAPAAKKPKRKRKAAPKRKRKAAPKRKRKGS